MSCKAALLVLWEDREWFQVGLATLEHEPGCAEAVAALQDLRRRRVLGKKRDSSAHLEPGRDDYRLPMVLPLLSRTIVQPACRALTFESSGVRMIRAPLCSS